MTKSATATPGRLLGQVSTVKMDGSCDHEEMGRGRGEGGKRKGRGGGEGGDVYIDVWREGRRKPKCDGRGLPCDQS